tara:strand:+ start:501 stop:740 length:240 start_codon:yes stop_codon:yes gene_type:complete
MTYNNFKYVIIESSELASLDFSKIINNSANTLRKSIDSSKAIIKYKGERPDFLDGKLVYSHEEIFVEMQKADWWNGDTI